MGGPRVFPGRYTAELGADGMVVVLIGMRFNHWWRVDKWLFVMLAMFRSLRHLADRDEGLLANYTFLGGRTTLMVQYWRSMDELQKFASNPDAPHLAAWRRYVRRIGNDGSVGAYHEAYQVRPGGTDVVYVNMPAFGLAGATAPVKVDAGRNTARQRVSYGTPEPPPASRASEHTESGV
ncbi:DUF4188 domain-containing protein [Pseudonocardia acaciae]|uniref:DUF4188 domain-containing protein n=1 Tax=Pseudonocardia acaciae TaxID=551276 RepID=UPI0007E8B760|nr:DUF4188 domain-containing protein [Pseudonocardia acaciae]